MKESKFIELLNLYVDHQISPADAALLETEVRINPEHRRVYREYCQMQKACSVLAENFRSEAPASDPKLVDFQPRRAPAQAVAYGTGLVAVAACVALVLGVRSRLGEPADSQPAANVQLAVTPVTTSAATSSVESRPALQPVFGPGMLTSRVSNGDLATSAAGEADFGDWMNSIQLSSMPGTTDEDLRFDAHAALQPEVRTYRAGRPLSGKVEWTAFTFQK